MSKMSEIAMELDDQAMELGFESYEDAIERGGYTTYFNGTTYVLAKANADEQEVAHEAWLKEKDKVLEEQEALHDHLMELGYDGLAESVWHAIEFFKKGEV